MGLAFGTRLLGIVREPLLHFLLIGIAVFVVYRLVVPPAPEINERMIEVTAAQAERLTAQFEAVWNRPPSEAERTGLIDDFVREEVYYREALALGLDRDDTVIRRRLRQKMEFLSDAGASALTPDDGELRAHFAEAIERFTPPAQITFRQIALDGADPEPILAKLAEGEDPLQFGRGTLLPPGMEAAQATAVDGTFGQGFFAALSELEPGVWSGPVESAFGKHLVEVLELVPAAPPPFETVRADVEDDWRRETAESLREAYYQALREGYDVIMPPAGNP